MNKTANKPHGKYLISLITALHLIKLLTNRSLYVRVRGWSFPNKAKTWAEGHQHQQHTKEGIFKSQQIKEESFIPRAILKMAEITRLAPISLYHL
jgi:hypothetical protein